MTQATATTAAYRTPAGCRHGSAMPSWRRRLRIACVAIVAAIFFLCGMTHAQDATPAPSPNNHQLDLGSPNDTDLPAWFYADRLARLDAHLAAATKRAANINASDVAVAEAQKNLLLVARALLVAGRDNGRQGHLATLYALTLLDGLEQFNQLTDALPKQVNEALRAKGDHAQKRVDELTQAVQSIRAFNAAMLLDFSSTVDATDDQPERLLDITTPDDLDAYMRQTLSPLTPMAQRLESRRVRSTWAELESGGSVSAPYLKQQLQKLDNRLKRSALDKTAAQNLGKMLDVLRDAATFADLRPRAAALARQIERLIDVTDHLSQPRWLDQRARAQLQSQQQTAVTLIMEPATREDALQHIARLERLVAPADTLTQLTQIQSIPIANLRAIFTTVLTLQDDPKLTPTADALTHWLTRLTQVLAAHHSQGDARKAPADQTGLPLDIRKVFVQLQQQYDQLETQTLAALPDLASDPTHVTQPKWTEPLIRMGTLAQQMQHLRQIPDWAKRMNRINPMAVRGLYKQYLLIAQDLLKPATADGATGALAEMDRQLALFEHLPGEDLLTQNDPDLIKLLGNKRAALWQQLLVLRSQWAAAWGAGIDPTPTGNKLLLMRRLMSDLVTAAKLPQVEQASAKLNRWAAWEADAGVWGPVQQHLGEELRLAQEQAGGEKWDDLAKTLDRADAAAAALGLVADLTSQLDGAMDKIGEGFAVTLSQCLYSPGPHAVAGAQRQTLATFCIYLAAAADAKTHHPDDFAKLSDRVGQLAIKLRAELASHSAAAIGRADVAPAKH